MYRVQKVGSNKIKLFIRTCRYSNNFWDERIITTDVKEYKKLRNVFKSYQGV